MNIFEFMDSSPWLAFFLALCVYYIIFAVMFKLPNRILRHWNIRKHGYPPAHCDADGDLRTEKKEKRQILTEGRSKTTMKHLL